MKPSSDLLSELNRKGLDSNIPYRAIVVDNNDPEQMFRIKARIPKLQDAIGDDDLPWLIPEDNIHGRGLKGGSLGHSAKVAGIPKRDSWVAIYYRHSGDPHHGSYSQRLPFDKKTIPEEFEVNYPDRWGSVFPSGYLFVHDEKTGETFLNMPGDAHLTIFGDVHQTVVGNYQLHVAKEESAIPSYLADNVSSLYESLGKRQQGRVAFKGFRGKDSGNFHLIVEGDYTQDIRGEFESKIGKNYKQDTTGTTDIDSGSNVKVNGSRIDLG